MQVLITAANVFVGIISWHTLKSHRVIVKRSQSQGARKSNLDVKLLRTSKFSEQVRVIAKSLNTCRFSNVSSLFCKATNFSCSRFYVTIGGQSWICISTWTLTPPILRWLSTCHSPFWRCKIYFHMKCLWCCQSERHRFDRNVTSQFLDNFSIVALALITFESVMLVYLENHVSCWSTHETISGLRCILSSRILRRISSNQWHM